MPHGGQRRAAKRVRRSETFINLVMTDEFQPKTPRGQKTLDRARAAIAEIIGKSVEEVFPVEQPTSARVA